MIIDIKNGNKIVKTKDYNYVFRKKDGYFMRWGKTLKEDPQHSKVGPEILDIEVTTICNHGCKFCYKNNNVNGINMTLETFKDIVDKMLPTKEQAGITQIAFGADATCKSNPDLFNMMDYARERGIVPNITVANIDNVTADRLLKRVGAVAVSRYANKDHCYDSVKRLTDRGLTQTNIHIMISEETFQNALQTMSDYLDDKRLEKLNAIVFLSLKQKGRGVGFTPLSQERFKILIDFAFMYDVPIGFDSCSAHKFLEAVKDRHDYKQLEENVEPCESGCFSSYIDAKGDFYPCSFAEGCKGWKTGLSLKDVSVFMEIWNHQQVKDFREHLIKKKRHCPFYEV